MNIEQVRGMLLWSAIINYVFLALWGLLYLLARDLMHRLARWWRLSPEQFDAFQFGGIMLYKMGPGCSSSFHASPCTSSVVEDGSARHATREPPPCARPDCGPGR